MAHRLAPERLLTALLDSAEEAILSVSLDGTIETWSAGAERLYGYTAREMTGQSLSRLLPLYEFSSMETLLSQTGCNGCPSTELGKRLHKNGSRILLATRRDLIRGGNGEVLGILEIARRLESHEAFLSPAEAPLPLLMEQVPGLLWDDRPQSAHHLKLGRRVPFRKDSPRLARGTKPLPIPRLR